MDLILISDTHLSHGLLDIPPCDLLVHAGDWSRHGTREESEDFFAWLGAQPARARVLTPGNHDFFAEREPAAARELARRHNITWLVNEGADVLGLRVWASPFSPRHGSWAFQDERGDALRARYTFPAGLDLLVTHGPPHGVCDRITRGDLVGCEALLGEVRARPPKVHVFGHVHESHGEARLDDLPTLFVNASSYISTSSLKPQTLDVRPPRALSL